MFSSTPVMPSSQTLLPRRAPDPHLPFCNRQAELAIIQKKLESISCGQPGALPIMCFWGAAGIGKSWLLAELEQRYRRDGRDSGAVGPPTVAARLDMDRTIARALWRNGKLDRPRVIQELWHQLAEQIRVPMQDSENFSLEEQTRQFVDQVTRWLENFTPVILFDTMDNVVRDDEAAFLWLEKDVVEPLAMTDRVLLVFAARGELRRWKRFQVRRRVDLFPLAAFDALTAGEAVGANAGVSRALYRHAFGHPLANEYLARLLSEQGLPLQTATEEEAEAALTPALVQTALREVVRYIFARVPDTLRTLAQAAAVLRWVNVEPLRGLAEGLRLIPSGRSDADYLDLIGQLQACHLLYWEISDGTFRVPMAVRRLLAHALELEEPDRFRAVHVAAYAFHRQHVEEFPWYLARYVPEAAYHGAVLCRLGSVPEEAPNFSDWWNKFLAQQAPKDVEPWNELREVLESDRELQETMPTEEYRALHRTTAQHGGAKIISSTRG